MFSLDELRDVFTLKSETVSDTYEKVVLGVNSDSHADAFKNSHLGKRVAKLAEQQRRKKKKKMMMKMKRSLVEEEEEESSEESPSSEEEEEAEEQQEEEQQQQEEQQEEEKVGEVMAVPPVKVPSRAEGRSICVAQVGEPDPEDLKKWGHHGSPLTVPDEILREVGKDDVTFVFTCEVSGCPIKELDGYASKAQQPLEEKSSNLVRGGLLRGVAPPKRNMIQKSTTVTL